MPLRLTLAHLGLIIFPDAIHEQVQHIGLLLMDSIEQCQVERISIAKIWATHMVA
jgi:hypothetical protein